MSYLNLLTRSLDASTIAWRDMCDASIPNLELTLYDAFVRQLKGCFAWNNLDWLLLYVAFDDQSSRINRFSPGTLDAVKVNSPTFVQYEGWLGSSNNYVSEPQTLAQATWSQNNVAVFGATLTEGQSAVGLLTSQNTTPDTTITPRNTSDLAMFRLTSGNSNQTRSNTTAKGFYAASRTLSTGYDSWIGASKTALTRNSAAPAVLDWRVPAGASASLFRVSLAGCGQSMTDAQILNIRAAYNAYMTGLGKNPI